MVDETTPTVDPDVRDSLAESVQHFQRMLVDVSTGKRKPPPWFNRTGFDTAEVNLDSLGTLKLVAASAGAMQAIDLNDDGKNPQVGADLEMNAVIEAIEFFPPTVKLRRGIKIRNREFNAGNHWENLWKPYDEDKHIAREILRNLIGGRAYEMLKMATMWLSKADMQTMVGMDPEPGNGKPGEERPTV